MTLESQLLLSTLRDVRMDAPSSIDWNALLLLADSHGVLPLFCRQYKGTLPDLFRTSAREKWTASAYLAAELASLLEHFCLRELEVIPLKGPLMAQTLYGSPHLRQSDDLDLLVRPQDFGRAQMLLSDLGFQPAYPADDYHQTFQRGNTWVELHFSVAPPSSPTMDLHGCWERSQTALFRGHKARTFAASDLVIYLVIHGIKHEFARLIWALDLASLLAGLDDREADQVLGTAHSLDIQGALLTACEISRLGFQTTLPVPIVEAISRTPVISVQATNIWNKILAGPANAHTERQGAALFLQLEQNFKARWCQRMRYFRLSQQDHLLARQYDIPPRGMIFLRPLRLLAKHGPGAIWRMLFPLPR